MDGLHRGYHTQFPEPANVRRVKKLGMLNAMAQPCRLATLPLSGKGIQDATVCLVSNRVHGTANARPGRKTDHVLKLPLAGYGDTPVVGLAPQRLRHLGRLRPKAAVSNYLDMPDSKVFIAEAAT
jgi:hypothetical protein